MSYFTAIILKVITLEVCLMQKDHCPNADTPKYKLFHQYRWCCSLSFFDAKTPKNNLRHEHAFVVRFKWHWNNKKWLLL